MNYAIILSAGKSERFGGSAGAKGPAESAELNESDKLFAPILQFPLIYHTIQAFNDHPLIDGIVIVANGTNNNRLRTLVKKYQFSKVSKIITGGETRHQSSRKGFQAIKKISADANDIILFHNGANPLVTETEITATIQACIKHGSAGVGQKAIDTIKEIKNGKIINTIDRENIAQMQTPQGATFKLFEQAFGATPKATFTDECALLENIGINPTLIPASENNFKVTTAKDYERVKHILGDTPKDFLVGIGQDSHAFATGKKGLHLGGKLFPNECALSAESDGDVILHALYNAISQAIGGKSIGALATALCHHQNIKDSRVYLRHILTKATKKDYKLNNIGIMLECAKPKIDDKSTEIKTSLSKLTGLPTHRIGITATSGEKLTAFGKGKGIQCFAIVSLSAIKRQK